MRWIPPWWFWPPRKQGVLFGLIFGLIFGVVFGISSGAGLLAGVIIGALAAWPSGWLFTRIMISMEGEYESDQARVDARTRLLSGKGSRRTYVAGLVIIMGAIVMSIGSLGPLRWLGLTFTIPGAIYVFQNVRVARSNSAGGPEQEQADSNPGDSAP